MTLDLVSPRTRRIKISLTVISILVAVAGATIGLLSLAAAAGIWFGSWDFRRGFDLLRIANEYGDIVAWGGAVVTIAIVIASKLFNTGNTLRLGTLAAIGTVIAGVAYAIPESFRPPEGVNYPPIHDISTNQVSPPQFVDVLPLRVNAANTTEYGMSANMTPQQLAQLTREAYPDLVPQTYPEPREVVFNRALSAVSELGWDLVAADPDAGRIEATATTFWFRFKDDIVITLADVNGQTLVNARSVSRVGTGDVGANAIRLRKFFALM